MTELEKGPTGRRRGRGARERILSASQQLFREQGINRTGMDQLCAAAEVSKRTAYQHFTGKDELVAEYLRRFDPSVLSGVFDRTDLTPRERLLAAFDIPVSDTHLRAHETLANVVCRLLLEKKNNNTTTTRIPDAHHTKWLA
nr:helix-turn-helix domain-containing protein [Streptomyces sabulosicollis]